MNIDAIPSGFKPPWDINVIVEVPKGGEPVKYELDKTSGALYVDRIMHTAMRYPCNYGFMPHTLSEDGDPIDVLIASDPSLFPGCVVRARPVGVLYMTDEAGPDEKILSVPVDKLHPYYTGVESYEDLPEILREQISHFFLHYKDLEPNKWVKLDKWGGPDEAAALIEQAIKRAGN